MKIRLAILENDSNYLNRIVNVFTTRFTDRLEVYSFTAEDQALGMVQTGRIDVFLADEAFTINPAAVPKGCGFGYLVESSGIDLFRDQTAVCKYQKPDLIYRQILSLFSEQSGNAVVLSQADESCRVITFTSPAGGCGCSTVAAAYAVHEANKGRRTLYLNLEKYGTSDVFFNAEGQFTMTDLIFSLKSKKTNLALRLESCMRQDPSGVFFFAPSRNALDMIDLNAEECGRLISEIKLSGIVDTLVVDVPFGLDKQTLGLLKNCGYIVLVGDGSETSNNKIHRALSSLQILEENEKLMILGRTHILYNKFSNKTGGVIQEYDSITLGGAPKYEHATAKVVMNALSELMVFEQITF